MQTDSRVRALRACASDLGASSRTGLASTGLPGPCERPVPGYGENHSGNLDDASIKATPGSVIQNRLASMGLLGPCERPVPGYGKNHSGNLDDASIKATRCR